MYGTIISIIASILLGVYYTAQGLTFELQDARFALLCSGTLFLFLAFIATPLVWSVLQKREEESNPRVEELFLKDKRLLFTLSMLFLITLFSYIVAFLPAQSISWHASLAIICWIVLIGVSFDLLCQYIRRMMKYSYQEFVLDRVTDECLRAVQAGKEADALEWLDAVVEVSVKATKNSCAYLAGKALFQMLTIIEGFVKNAGRSLTASEMSTSASLLDKVQYLSAYVSKKFEWVFKNAIRENQDPVAEEVITAFGKMSLYFVKWHPSLTHLPLVYIERCANLAVDAKCDEVVTRACLTLSELAKTFITLARDKGESYRESIFLSFSHLEELLKNNFQKNKDLFPALLMQPFAEVGEMIGEDSFKNFPDREDVLKELRRILGEFNALDLVLSKVQFAPSEPSEQGK